MGHRNGLLCILHFRGGVHVTLLVCSCKMVCRYGSRGCSHARQQGKLYRHPLCTHPNVIQQPLCMQITSSGAHRCVCVQLRLYNLAVAAIERCEALAEMEGAGSVGVDPAAGPAFKVLKQLVHNWLTDAVQNGNRCTSTAFCCMHRGSSLR